MHLSYRQYETIFRNHGFNNIAEIKASRMCSCFHCYAVFGVDAIKTYVTDCNGLTTATCPTCDMDSVIGDASRLPIIKLPFMQHMHFYAFEHAIDKDGILMVKVHNATPYCRACKHTSAQEKDGMEWVIDGEVRRIAEQTSQPMKNIEYDT